jgi:hypothetical protein
MLLHAAAYITEISPWSIDNTNLPII